MRRPQTGGCSLSEIDDPILGERVSLLNGVRRRARPFTHFGKGFDCRYPKVS